MALKRHQTLFVCAILGVGAACAPNPQPTVETAPPQETAKAADPISPAPPDARPVVVAFGDSLSAGFGADPGKSFPDFLQKRIDATHKKYRVENAGISGDTTTDGLARLSGILDMHPKIVILEFGGNDGLRGIPVSTTKENLARMILAFQNEKVQVLLAAITLPRNYGPDFIRQFDEMYLDLAATHGVKRIPFLLEGVGTDPHLMQRDGIHPTSEGNQKVADTVFQYLKPML